MISLYYFNDKNFDGELRQVFSSCGVTLDYENSLNKFLSKTKDFKPNLVVLDYDDLSMDKVFEDLFCISSEFFVPFLVLLSKEKHNIKLPNCYIIKKDENKNDELKKVLSQIFEMLQNNLFVNFKKGEVIQSLANVFDNFAFSQKLNGTFYLKECVKMCVCEGLRGSNTISNILEQVAVFCEAKPANIERCLRSLIQHMWQNEDKPFFNDFFKTKPSTKVLVRSVSEYVLENMSNQQKMKKFA